MNIYYLITAQRFPNQLVKTISALQDDDVSFHIHLDAGYYTSKYATHFSLRVPVVSLQNVPLWMI